MTRSQSRNRQDRDRRRAERFDTALTVGIRLMESGPVMEGSAIELGPNGMRIITQIPLVEASLVHISISGASNNTHCDGRVVWTQRGEDPATFESGVDVQRWGGGIPGEDVIDDLPTARTHPDRRRKRRAA